MPTDRFRILAVDDDKDILDLIYMTLGTQYEVLTLNDAVDACEILEFFEPDLVIVDVMMPKVTGYQIVEFMKKSPKYQHVLIVFLSAKDSSHDIKYGYKIGANFYLTKPFQPERLHKNVELLLSQAGDTPHKKQYSMRDVELRMKFKMGLHMPPQLAEQQAAAGGDPAVGSSSHKLRRPLAHEAQDQEDRKWRG